MFGAGRFKEYPVLRSMGGNFRAILLIDQFLEPVRRTKVAVGRSGSQLVAFQNVARINPLNGHVGGGLGKMLAEILRDPLAWKPDVVDPALFVVQKGEVRRKRHR